MGLDQSFGFRIEFVVQLHPRTNDCEPVFGAYDSKGGQGQTGLETIGFNAASVPWKAATRPIWGNSQYKVLIRTAVLLSGFVVKDAIAFTGKPV